MSELLVLPDIHGRVFWKHPCEDVNRFQRVIFLGDYTDPYSFEEITPAATVFGEFMWDAVKAEAEKVLSNE